MRRGKQCMEKLKVEAHKIFQSIVEGIGDKI